MKGTKKYGNKIFIITENQTNALREEINMADYKKNGNFYGENIQILVAASIGGDRKSVV